LCLFSLPLPSLNPSTSGNVHRACIAAIVGCVVSQLSITISNSQDNHLINRRGLFWLIILEVPVNGQTNCFWAYGKAAHCDGGCMADQNCSLMTRN
jgi:hypothetical protein